VSEWSIVDGDGVHLFTVDFMPAVGMIFRFDSVGFFLSKDKDRYKKEYLEHLEKMHGQEFVIESLYCDVRYGAGNDTLVKFAVADINPEKSPD